MHIPLVHPSSILIAGPSGSGKTVFVRKLILERMIFPMPTRIVIVFSEWQNEYEILKEKIIKLNLLKDPSRTGYMIVFLRRKIIYWYLMIKWLKHQNQIN